MHRMKEMMEGDAEL